METAEESRPVQRWMDVLDRIEQSLHESLSLANEPAIGPIPGLGGGAAALQVLDDRLERWQASLDRTSADATQAENLVAAEETSLSESIKRMGAVREKLTTQGKRPV